MRRSGFKTRGKPLAQRSAKAAGRADADRAWAEAVWARDRGECQAERLVPEVECQGRRDPHHIRPKGVYPELRHDVDNGVTLCRAHHDWVHFQEPARAKELGLSKGELPS